MTTKETLQTLTVATAELRAGQDALTERVAALEQLRAQEMTELRELLTDTRAELTGYDKGLAAEIANARAAWPAKATAAVASSLGIVGGIIVGIVMALTQHVR